MYAESQPQTSDAKGGYDFSNMSHVYIDSSTVSDLHGWFNYTNEWQRYLRYRTGIDDRDAQAGLRLNNKTQIVLGF